MKSDKLWSFIKYFLVAGILLLLAFILVRNLRELSKYDFQINWIFLVSSFFLLAIATLALHLNWHLITKSLECNLNLVKSIASRIKSELGKYIPGRVLGYGYLIINYTAEGKDPLRVLSSSVYELYLSTFSSMLFFTILQLFVPFRLFEQYKFVFIAISIAGILSLHPVFFQKISDMLCRLLKRERLTYRISFLNALGILSSYIGYWIIFSSAFMLFARSFANIRISDLFYLSGSFAISSFAGFVAFFLPAGLGAREGVLVFLLTSLTGNILAITISIGSRIWIILCDIILFFVALFTGSGKSLIANEK